ncbi:hypothetical protein AU255_10505 [Methyloprofundus sedimenti]|uniref:Alginate export domain-containing protein n=1 Tax=Methyloprofundus sedimenti TaxID=1420851 RepID=A0A1V8M9M0_9GAMM|nr:hypothetical protein [Methyloprofundus sedimenti]OQK18237.1 hypothetical protein AU255_10505 [Methyloprofundus sedimenti]
MKAVPFFLSTVLLLPMPSANSAWNWNGTVKAKVQGDNRYTRYTDDSQVFGEVWGSFVAFDNESWRTSLDFVARQSSLFGFEGDIYQLVIEKLIEQWDTTIQAGRFQRSDSLGFYSLDGVAVRYQLPNQGLTFNVYGGRPTRQEDVRTVQGDWLYGLELMSNQQLDWDNRILPIKTWLFRFGFQQFHDEHTSTRLTMANTIEGEFEQSYLHAYELSFMATLETNTGVFEEVYSSLLLDITEASRIRVSYSLYEPKIPYPTFKEKFYSDYHQGRQDLVRVSYDQELTETFSYHIGGKRAARNEGEDIGYGFDAGVRSHYFRNFVLSGDFDMLEFGTSSSYNLYFSSEYSLSRKSLLVLDLAYSLDESPLYGQNKAAGTQLGYRYKLFSDVFIDISGSYIVNSRLDNEYQAGLQATWYFDNFQPKAKL